MDPTPLETIAAWTGGTLRTRDADVLASVVCTDTRALQGGDLYVALRGDRFDGHAFAIEAERRGALAAVLETVSPELPDTFPVIQVADTLKALQQMASNYRRRLNMQVVAITGSNGKTSTKDLTASVLSQRFQVTKTDGNFNNHIGLPLTILRARGSDDIGVFEIGMNHPGEIAPLAEIAAPDVAIITGIGVAHLEFMGTRDAIAQEKGMLAEALKPGGHLVLPVDDPYAASIAARSKGDAVYVGLGKGDVQASNLRPHFHGMRFTITSKGHSVEAELSVPSEHMVRNALLAVAVGQRFGLSLADCAEGLRNLKLTKGRLEQKIVRGIHVLDDTYNANPDSVAAALTTLAQMPAAGRRIAVLGVMGELGAGSEEGHRRVGDVAVSQGVDYLIGVGAEARWITENAYRGGLEKVVHVATTEEAVLLLREAARAGDVVLVKGSRSARMERVVEGLQAL
jgi:UDP-N-acetylmuramoyl-tripeptide--D-alanyl-D-alanine ligase